MATWSIAALRTILATETDADSPGSEELLGQMRENWEALTMLAFDTGITTTSTSIAETIWTDTGTPFANVEVGMTLLITSGAAIGNTYTIDATDSADTVTCTGDTLVTDGVVITDTAKVMYDLKVNADGHDHDGVNSKGAALANGSVTYAKLSLSNEIDQGDLAANSVGQSELKDASQDQSVAINDGNNALIATTGGAYGWSTISADSPTGHPVGFGHGDEAAGTYGFANRDGTSRTAYIAGRYFQASPPYNMGDGDIPMFIYVLMHNNGEIRGVSVAEDPIWAHHGSTIIRAQRRCKLTNKSYRKYKTLDGIPFAEAIKNKDMAKRYLNGQIDIEETEMEITQEMKHRDMDIIPHPYLGNDLTDITPIMLDPVNPMMERFYEISRQVGGKEVFDIVNKGYLIIGNEKINRKAPKATMPVSFKWK